MYVLKFISIDGKFISGTMYINNLQRFHSFYPLNNGMAFAMADLLPSGQLAKTYCLIQRIMFHLASDSSNQENLFS